MTYIFQKSFGLILIGILFGGAQIACQLPSIDNKDEVAKWTKLSTNSPRMRGGVRHGIRFES